MPSPGPAMLSVYVGGKFFVTSEEVDFPFCAVLVFPVSFDGPGTMRYGRCCGCMMIQSGWPEPEV